MTDWSGCYGILQLLSSKAKLPVMSLPVNSDVLTFGCDTTCDVWMYFTFVSPLHAKLVFEDKQVIFPVVFESWFLSCNASLQAFLSVMGMQGIIVNGKVVMPSLRSGEPIIFPLQDLAEFTIHNKIFKFEYPNSDTHSIWVQVGICILSIGLDTKLLSSSLHWPTAIPSSSVSRQCTFVLLPEVRRKDHTDRHHVALQAQQGSWPWRISCYSW